MNAIDFVTKVREMRQAQKDFFQFRCAQTLGLAKKLEREVDAALEEGVTVYATSTLEEMDGVPAEGEQLGMFGVDFAAGEDITVIGDAREIGDEPDAADLLDLSGE